MALDNLIIQWISTQLANFLYKRHVFAPLANRSFQGEIRFGGSVKMNQIGAVDVSDYTKNVTELTPQFLSDAATILHINQAKSINVIIDRIDQVQMNVDIMEQLNSNSAYALSDAADSYMAVLYGESGMSIGATTAVDLTSGNVVDTFLQASELMNENNVPPEGRFSIIPPWVLTKLVHAGIQNLSENNAVFTNGNLGTALGFQFRLSNNVSKADANWQNSRIICGVQGQSIGFVEQINDVRMYEPEKRHGTGLKILYVFGAKVMRPDMTLTLYANKTAEV